MKPPADHEMNDEKEFVFQREDDALAETPKRQHSLSFSGTDRRIEGAQDKRATDTDFLNRLIQDPLRERLDINSNVRKFRHAYWVFTSSHASIQLRGRSLPLT